MPPRVAKRPASKQPATNQPATKHPAGKQPATKAGATHAVSKRPQKTPSPRRRRRPPAPPRVVYDRLAKEYPDAKCALDFHGPFQLLVATILSAQCTDKRVNMVTPDLFRRYPDPEAMAAANPPEVE